MSELFLTIFNTAVTAGWLVLAVLIARLLLKNAPGWAKCALWAVVALRLIWPFELESIFSLVPSAQTLPPTELMAPAPEIHTGIPYLNSAINPTFTQTFRPEPAASVNPLQIVVMIASVLWIVGMVAMAGHAAFSYLRLRRRVAVSIPAGEGVYLCDTISSPFILGLVKPKIYLPSELPREQWDAILSHERAHLARRDHWWKPLGFVLLTVFWFHPLLWVAYVLLCRDVELACDEKVIKALSPEEKQAYSQTLLECSMPRKWITACPLAFGETSVKTRIKAVLHYKKPTLWIIIAALVICSVLAVCFLTEPMNEQQEVITEKDVAGKIYVYQEDDSSLGYQIWIREDGTYLHPEVGLSSTTILYNCYWELKDGKLYLHEGGKTIVFQVERDALIYLAEESDPFQLVNVADGSRFAFYAEIDSLEELTSCDAVGFYHENSGDFGWNFGLSVMQDGRFSYSEGLLNSSIAFGNWEMKNGKLHLTDGERCFVFEVRADGLVYLAGESDRGLYLEDGQLLVRRQMEKYLTFVQPTDIQKDHFLALDAMGNTWRIEYPCGALGFKLSKCWVSYYGQPEIDEEGRYRVRAAECWLYREGDGEDGTIYDSYLFDVDSDGTAERCYLTAERRNQPAYVSRLNVMVYKLVVMEFDGTTYEADFLQLLIPDENAFGTILSPGMDVSPLPPGAYVCAEAFAFAEDHGRLVILAPRGGTYIVDGAFTTYEILFKDHKLIVKQR